jgi:hypothetical protein
MSVAGTPRKLLLDGESFDLIADADFTLVGSKYEKESIQTSGDPIVKTKKRSEDVEAEIGCNSKKFESLKEKANSLSDLTVSFTLADGSSYKGKGQIHMDTWSAQDNKIKIKIVPTSDGWTFFE